jgi:hypothetical protein
MKRVKELRKFKTDFEAKWNLDENGIPKRATGLDDLLGRSFGAKMKQVRVWRRV